MRQTKHAISNVELRSNLRWPYAWAIFFVSVAFALRYFLLPYNSGLAFNTFYPAVILSFYFVGTKAGILSIALSLLVSNYFFIAPYFSLSFGKTAELGSFFFVFTTSLIGYLTHQKDLQEQRFRILLEDQADLISRFKTNGELLYANSAYLNFFGIDKQDIQNRQWQPLVFEADLQMVSDKVKTINFNNPVVVIENRVYDANRNIRWYQFINHGIFSNTQKLIEIQSVGRDMTSLKEQQDDINFIAHHDALTGLPNRLLFEDRLKQAIAHAKRNNTSTSVCFLDLDGFKPVNDTYGHGAGDEVLIEVSRRMQNCLRENDTVSRMGGDEFMIIINDDEQNQQSKQILARVLEAVSKPITLNNKAVVAVTASAGVSAFPKDADDAAKLIRLADEKMYQAKATGRNKVLYDLNAETLS